MGSAQAFLVLPVGAPAFGRAARMGTEAYHSPDFSL